ncbi:cell envelope integrity protein TolA [Corynebacterium diphtheriae]|nr:cell envelope integrity protein TolA [Corynebacterium diphtheriae]CAB0938268.1 cell envelope integrity protein TolA [Corynebacterium diphtheriae]CAB0970792.1 cell envelope integrity protein TolA [Corynebacterium diphtheriae]
MDFADRGWDYRDRYRKGGGPSRMTTRRLLLLVDGLDRNSSRFWAEITDSDRFSTTDYVLMIFYLALIGEVHPMWNRREEERKKSEFEAKKKAVLAAERARKKRLGIN